MTYAARTEVDSTRSRHEIERTISRYGADGFGYGWTDTEARVAFRIADRHVMFVMGLPDRQDRRFTHHSRGVRTVESAEREYEQAIRQRWRALALVIKAKLEAVEAGIATVEEEFLAYIVLPGGETVYDWVRAPIEQAYETGQLPALNMFAIPEKT